MPRLLQGVRVPALSREVMSRGEGSISPIDSDDVERAVLIQLAGAGSSAALS